MKKLLGIIAALVLIGGPARAQSTATPVVTGYLTTVGCQYGLTTCFVQFGANGPAVVGSAAVSTGYQKLTSLATAMTFTPPVGSTFCIVTAETAALRFRTDGVAPTATVGVPLAIGQNVAFRMSIASLSAISIIQQSAGGAADVDCYKDA